MYDLPPHLVPFRLEAWQGTAHLTYLNLVNKSDPEGTAFEMYH